MTIKHLDLFSGIGGFKLAADFLEPGLIETEQFVEINEYAYRLDTIELAR